MKRSFFVGLAALILGVALIAGCLSVNGKNVTLKAGIWFETAYAEWTAESSDTKFNVEIRLNSGDWQKVDEELLRIINANDNIWRVDVPGLRNTVGTTYDLRVLNADNIQVHIKTGLVPIPFDRQGYAFTLNAATDITTTTGGYNEDGTVHADAEIIYVTHANMDTVLTNEAFNTRTTPLILRFIGKVGTYDGTVAQFIPGNAPSEKNLDIPLGCNNMHMYIINNSRNITIEGIGYDAYIEGWGFTLQNSNNVVIRNLKFDRWYDDAVYLNSSNSAWITHNAFGYGVDRYNAPPNPNGSDQGEFDHIKGDGATDISNTSTNFTVSYNQYNGSGKSMLIGGGAGSQIGHGTVHHNLFNRTDERTPRLRNGWVHVFNNIYDNVGGEPGGGMGYGIGAGHRANIVAEGNTFIRTYRPYIISGERSANAAGPNGDGNINTLSNDAPGIILTSQYAGTPDLMPLVGRSLVPDSLDAWSTNTSWYFPAELTLTGGPTLTNNMRGVPREISHNFEMTYSFVPFHTATGWRADGQTGTVPGTTAAIGGPAPTFAARVAINDTLSSNIGVQSAAAGADRVRQMSGVMRKP